MGCCALGARRARGGGGGSAARDRAAAGSCRASPSWTDGAPDLAGLPAADAAVAALERHLDRLGEPHPALELGLRWLRLHPPPAAPPSIVHGDFRLSNLVVAEDGRPALIDWELVHTGDGAEDLGWMCMRSWRFGSPLPALGCGTREELLAAYAAAGGRAVSSEELRWWEVCANARWGVICILQASRHLTGVDRSLERAMIGRRTCEAEWDLLALLAGDRPAPRPERVAAGRADRGRAARDGRRVPRATCARARRAEDAFPLAVAANACRVVARELPPDDPAPRERAARLAAALRARGARRRARRARRHAARRGAGEARGR